MKKKRLREKEKQIRKNVNFLLPFTYHRNQRYKEEKEIN